MNAPIIPARAKLVGGPSHARVFHASHVALADVVARAGGANLLCADPPYSDVTHAGHYANSTHCEARDKSSRRELGYAHWTPADVADFVSTWGPHVRGWWACMTDDELAPAWKRALRARDLLVFPLLPMIIRGGGVRINGDGPSSVTRFLVVARPRDRFHQKWGTLPGFYDGPRERMERVGGKPLWLLRAIINDYSRPGQLVVDPTCGGGTALRAAAALGRRSIGGDIDLEACRIAVDALRAA